MSKGLGQSYTHPFAGKAEDQVEYDLLEIRNELYGLAIDRAVPAPLPQFPLSMLWKT
jgi:hypothetical protein